MGQLSPTLLPFQGKKSASTLGKVQNFSRINPTALVEAGLIRALVFFFSHPYVHTVLTAFFAKRHFSILS